MVPNNISPTNKKLNTTDLLKDLRNTVSKHRSWEEYFKAFRRLMVDIALGLFDTFVLPFSKLLPPLKRLSSKKQVFFVRLDAIGDFILWSAALSEYEKLYPKTEWDWTLIGSSEWKPLNKLIRPFEAYTYLDRKRFTRNLIYRWYYLLLLSRLPCDVLIHPTHSRTFVFAEAVVRAVRSKIKIGSSGDLSNMQAPQRYLSQAWYSHLVHNSRLPLMEIERHEEFLRGIGLNSANIETPKLNFDRIDVDKYLTELGLKGREYFVIFPGASWIGKRWPLSRFQKIAEEIHREHGWVCCVLGGGFEDKLRKELKVLDPNIFINLIGKTNLLAFASVVSQSKLVISNDSSAAHFAAATHVPCIALVGGGHFGRFMPYKSSHGVINGPNVINCAMPCYNCNWRCHYPPSNSGAVPCIDQITLDQVRTQIGALLSEKREAAL